MLNPVFGQIVGQVFDQMFDQFFCQVYDQIVDQVSDHKYSVQYYPASGSYAKHFKKQTNIQ